MVQLTGFAYNSKFTTLNTFEVLRERMPSPGAGSFLSFMISARWDVIQHFCLLVDIVDMVPWCNYSEITTANKVWLKYSFFSSVLFVYKLHFYSCLFLSYVCFHFISFKFSLVLFSGVFAPVSWEFPCPNEESELKVHTELLTLQLRAAQYGLLVDLTPGCRCHQDDGVSWNLVYHYLFIHTWFPPPCNLLEAIHTPIHWWYQIFSACLAKFL